MVLRSSLIRVGLSMDPPASTIVFNLASSVRNSVAFSFRCSEDISLMSFSRKIAIYFSASFFFLVRETLGLASFFLVAFFLVSFFSLAAFDLGFFLAGAFSLTMADFDLAGFFLVAFFLVSFFSLTEGTFDLGFLVATFSLTVEDLDLAGGIPAVMGELKSLLKLNSTTVTGKTVGDNITGVKTLDSEVIRSVETAHFFRKKISQ